jgi:hypothetical protein
VYAVLKNIYLGVTDEISEEIRERREGIERRRESEWGEKKRRESARRKTFGSAEIKHEAKEEVRDKKEEFHGIKEEVPEIMQEVPESNEESDTKEVPETVSASVKIETS